MDCPGFDRLMAWADGELPGDDAREVGLHVAACPECRRLVDSQTGLEKAWRESYVDPPEEAFRILERRVRMHPARSSWTSVAIPVAAALVFAVVGVRLLSDGGPRFLDHPAGPEVITVTPAGEYRMAAGEDLDEDASTGDAPDLQAVSSGPPEDQVAQAQTEEEEVHEQEQILDIRALGRTGSAYGEQSGGTAADPEDSRVRTTETVGGTSSSSQEASSAADQAAFALPIENTEAPYGGGGAGAIAGGTAGLCADEGEGSAYYTFDGDILADLTLDSAPDPASDEVRQVTRSDDFESVSGVCTLCPVIPPCGEVDALAREPGHADGTGDPKNILIGFDITGEPASPDSLFLDGNFPGWKDSLRGEMVDSIVLVTTDELVELME